MIISLLHSDIVLLCFISIFLCVTLDVLIKYPKVSVDGRKATVTCDYQLVDSLHAGYFFMILLSSAEFFQDKLFQKNLLRTLLECQAVWIKIRIKDHQLTAKVTASKEGV